MNNRVKCLNNVRCALINTSSCKYYLAVSAASILMHAITNNMLLMTFFTVTF